MKLDVAIAKSPARENAKIAQDKRSAILGKPKFFFENQPEWLQLIL